MKRVGKLVLSDGTTLEGQSFGSIQDIAGEVVFATGMTGYPQAFTDPSFARQILVMTYPLIGNYGVPEKNLWESDKLQIAGLIVSTYNDTPSHFQSKRTLASWLKAEHIPALEIKDTRFLAQHLREKGTMLGSMIFNSKLEPFDPNVVNLVATVSRKKITRAGKGDKTVLIIDCGAKRNIEQCFIKRGVQTIIVPWDFDPFVQHDLQFDALFISNGPGDPKMADKTIATIKKSLERRIPTLGICLGNQLLALAAGGDTSKLKFGHRSQNQPCILTDNGRCFITTQNHGFAISKIPTGFRPWFINANDQTCEGIIHKKLPFMAVQFHPEATPGPMDTEWIFDYFLERINVHA
jgi:carbamoyl-phosphate synthase small subunit